MPSLDDIVTWGYAGREEEPANNGPVLPANPDTSGRPRDLRSALRICAASRTSSSAPRSSLGLSVYTLNKMLLAL